MAMLPDVISHDAARNGAGRAGTFGGMWTAGETTGMALGATVLTVVLAITGYVAHTATPAVAAAGETQPASAVAGHRAQLQPRSRGDRRRQPDPACSATACARRTSMVAFDSTAILARLAALRAEDAPTHGGHVLSYVYDSGVAAIDHLAADAIRLVQPVNGLDPTTFTSVAVMEREVVGFARELLHGGDDVVGTVTTGGTESCLLAVKTARDVWRAAGGQGRARLVAPVTVHAAFQKAAHYFDLELDLVPVDPETGEVDPAALIDAPRPGCRARRRLGAVVPVRDARPGRRGRGRVRRGGDRLPRRRLHRRVDPAVLAAAGRLGAAALGLPRAPV